MTLGLATGDENGLYLAIDSSNVPMLCCKGYPKPINSKLIEARQKPVIAMLVAGGLWNWCEVVEMLGVLVTDSGALGAAALAIDSQLKRCPKPGDAGRPPSFGLICGFESATAVCIKSHRLRGRFISASN